MKASTDLSRLLHLHIRVRVPATQRNTGDYAVFFFGRLDPPIIIVDYVPDVYGGIQTRLAHGLSFDNALAFAKRVQEKTNSPIRIVGPYENEYYIEAGEDASHLNWVFVANRRNEKRRARRRAKG